MNPSAKRGLALLLPLAFSASTPLAQQPPTSAAVDHQIVVFMLPGLNASPLASAVGATIVDDIPGLGIFVLQFPPQVQTTTVKAIAKALDQLPITVLAEPNRVVQAPEWEGCAVLGQVGTQQCTIGFVDGIPSSSKYLDQGWLDTLGVTQAQQYLSGASSVVAIIDTGADLAHPALANRLFSPGYDLILDQVGAWEQLDGWDNDRDGFVDEAYGHGTHIAGTVALINPDALILPIRAMDTDGNGSAFHLAEGIWTAFLAGTDVVNLSVSMNQPSALVATMLAFAINSGIDVYSSAGNTGANAVLFPSNLTSGVELVPLSPLYPKGVLAVAAVDAQDLKAGFSAWGADVDLCAPGTDIYGPVPGGGYAWWSGTSMATGVASGVGSLLHSILGSSAPGADTLLLLGSSTPIDDLNPAYAGLLGAGRLSAIQAALSATQP